MVVCTNPTKKDVDNFVSFYRYVILCGTAAKQVPQVYREYQWGYPALPRSDVHRPLSYPEHLPVQLSNLVVDGIISGDSYIVRRRGQWQGEITLRFHVMDIRIH